MTSYDFPYYVSFGKGDSADGIVTVSLSDEEAARLEHSAHSEARWRVNEDPEIKDIFENVYNLVIENEISNLMDSDIIDDLRDEIDESDEYDDHDLLEYYLESLEIGINYPEELQLLE